MIPFDIKVQKGYVADMKGQVVGFITYTSFNDKPYIGWIGVAPDLHRKGVGRMLMNKVFEMLSAFGASEVLVETPAEYEAKGSDYESTYKFYTGMGFEVHRVMKMDEQGCEMDCDIAIMRKELR